MIPAVQLLISGIDYLRHHTKAYIASYLSHMTYDASETPQHYNLLWIPMTGRQQRREDIQDIFATVSYARSESDPFFIVLEYADCLTHAAANSMLKLLEEPPTGYHIILLASSEDAVLPTIRSRSQIRRFVTEDTYDHHPLYHLFSDYGTLHASQLQKILDDQIPTEYETHIIINALQAVWLRNYEKAVQSGVHHRVRTAETMVTILKNAMHNIPISGNVKLFWRILMCQINIMDKGGT